MNKKICTILFFALFFTPLPYSFTDSVTYPAKGETTEEVSPGTYDDITKHQVEKTIEEILYLLTQLGGGAASEYSASSEGPVHTIRESEPVPIVLARETSEPINAIISRSDFDTIGIPAISKAKAKPVSERKYSAGEIEAGKNSITIENEQIAALTFKGITRFLNTNPDIVDVTRTKDDELTVKALKLGESFIHI